MDLVATIIVSYALSIPSKSGMNYEYSIVCWQHNFGLITVI